MEIAIQSKDSSSFGTGGLQNQQWLRFIKIRDEKSQLIKREPGSQYSEITRVFQVSQLVLAFAAGATEQTFVNAGT